MSSYLEQLPCELFWRVLQCLQDPAAYVALLCTSRSLNRMLHEGPVFEVLVRALCDPPLAPSYESNDWERLYRRINRWRRFESIVPVIIRPPHDVAELKFDGEDYLWCVCENGIVVIYKLGRTPQEVYRLSTTPISLRLLRGFLVTVVEPISGERQTSGKWKVFIFEGHVACVTHNYVYVFSRDAEYRRKPTLVARLSHSGLIVDVSAWSNYMATCGDHTKSVYIWSLTTGNILATIVATNYMHAVLIHDGAVLVQSDGCLRLFQLDEIVGRSTVPASEGVEVSQGSFRMLCVNGDALLAMPGSDRSEIICFAWPSLEEQWRVNTGPSLDSCVHDGFAIVQNAAIAVVVDTRTLSVVRLPNLRGMCSEYCYGDVVTCMYGVASWDCYQKWFSCYRCSKYVYSVAVPEGADDMYTAQPAASCGRAVAVGGKRTIRLIDVDVGETTEPPEIPYSFMPVKGRENRPPYQFDEHIVGCFYHERQRTHVIKALRENAASSRLC